MRFGPLIVAPVSVVTSIGLVDHRGSGVVRAHHTPDVGVLGVY